MRKMLNSSVALIDRETLLIGRVVKTQLDFLLINRHLLLFSSLRATFFFNRLHQSTV
jgi:hypothetical protein